MSAVYERVKKIIVNGYKVTDAQVTPTANLSSDLNLDSLDRVELIMEFEKEFNISIPDEDVENIVTVQQAVDYLEQKVNSTTVVQE